MRITLLALFFLIYVPLTSANNSVELKPISNKAGDCVIYDQIDGNTNDYYMYWTGTCKNKLADGEGIALLFRVKDNDDWFYRFEGALKNGKYHGEGFSEWADSARGSSKFFHGKIDGDLFVSTKSYKTIRKLTYANGKMFSDTLLHNKDYDSKEFSKLRAKITKNQFGLNNKKKMRQYYKFGKSNFNISDCSRATHVIKADIFAQKFKARLLFPLAACYNDLELYEKTIEAYSKYEEFDSRESSYSYKFKAEAYFYLKKYKESLNYFRKISTVQGTEFYLQLLYILKSKEFQPFDAERNSILTDYSSRLASAYIRRKKPEMAKVACKAGNTCETFIDYQDNKHGNSMLITFAAFETSFFIFDYALQNGADLNLQNKSGTTALMMAAYSGNLKAVNSLIKHGAKLDIESKNGNSALTLALKKENYEIASELLKAGADIKSENKNGMTPLMVVAATSTPNAIKILLAQGAAINHKDNIGQTALTYAINNNKNENSTFLINNGANKESIVVRKFSNGRISSRRHYKEIDLVSVMRYSNSNDNPLIKSYTLIKDNEYFVKEFRWSSSDKEKRDKISSTYYVVNGKKHGELKRFRDEGTLAVLSKFDNGEIIETNLFSRAQERLTTKVSFVESKDVWKEEKYYSSGKLQKESTFKIQDPNNSLFSNRHYVGNTKIFGKNGEILISKKYEDGKVVGLNNLIESKIDNVFESYIKKPAKGLIYYLLELESAAGFRVDTAKAILDGIVNEAIDKISIKDKYSRSEALQVLNKIGSIIKDNNITYDDKHINILSETLTNREMDCDFISLLYLTVAEKLQLPIYLKVYPQHMALVWKDSNNIIYWEATEHAELDKVTYQNWLGDPNNITLDKNEIYVSKLSKKDNILHMMYLLSLTATTKEEQIAYTNKLIKELYVYSFFIPRPNNMNKAELLSYWSNVERIRKTKYQVDNLDNRNLIASMYFYNEYGHSDIYDIEASHKTIELLSSVVHKATTEKHATNLKLLIQAYENVGDYFNAILVLRKYLKLKGTGSKTFDLNRLSKLEKKMMKADKS